MIGLLQLRRVLAVELPSVRQQRGKFGRHPARVLSVGDLRLYHGLVAKSASLSA